VSRDQTAFLHQVSPPSEQGSRGSGILQAAGPGCKAVEAPAPADEPREEGRGRIFPITSRGGWLQKLTVTDPAVFSRATPLTCSSTDELVLPSPTF